MEKKGHFNIKMPPYQYRDSYHKDKMVLQPSYLYNGSPCTWGNDFIFRQGLKGLILLVPVIDTIQQA